MTNDGEMAALAAEFRAADGSDNWRCWRGDGDGLLYAWRLMASRYPYVLRNHTVDGLRARMTEFGRVLAETRSPSRALAAAEALET